MRKHRTINPRNGSIVIDTEIICKPDKDNGVVLLNKIDCVQRMNAILLDTKMFTLVKSDKKC